MIWKQLQTGLTPHSFENESDLYVIFESICNGYSKRNEWNKFRNKSEFIVKFLFFLNNFFKCELKEKKKIFKVKIKLHFDLYIVAAKTSTLHIKKTSKYFDNTNFIE